MIGPLAWYEFGWSQKRRWLFWTRLTFAVLTCLVLLLTAWFAWLMHRVGGTAVPSGIVRGSLVAVELLWIVVALLLSPALLAGTIAGEKDSGTIGLLITSALRPHEIILSRLLSRLGQVGTICVGGLPVIMVFAAWSGMEFGVILTSVGLPAAVALGAGGLAIGVSTSSRRGRDALLIVYFLWVAFLLAPLISPLLPVGPGIQEWVAAISPLSSVTPLGWYHDWTPALKTIAIWSTLGLGGVGWASVKLLQSFLRDTDGSKLKNYQRRRFVPAMGKRPMVWKELFVEKTSILGRSGRIVGGLIVVCLLGGALSILGGILWYTWMSPNKIIVSDLRDYLAIGIKGSSFLVSCLIQWAIGLRAAVAVSSEREQGTWDALLTSPLEAREIVWGKVGGSLYALRWLVMPVLVAWTIGLITGVWSLEGFMLAIANTVTISFFMAAAGVRVSLSTHSATKAMTLTIFIWVLSAAAIAFICLLLTLFGMLMILLIWLMVVTLGYASIQAGPPAPMSFETAWTLLWLASYTTAGIIVAYMCHMEFDRIVGRGQREVVMIDTSEHPIPLPAASHTAPLE